MNKPSPSRRADAGATIVENFLDMMSAERGASINTIAAYRRDLLDFCASGDARRQSRRARFRSSA